MGRAKGSVTIRDVAKAAGVSVSTVSRVLNNKEDVAEETLVRIQQIVNELGYTSSLAARSMRSRKTNVIGAIIIDLSDPFSTELIKGIDRAIREFNYDLIVYTSGRTAAITETAWEREHVTRLNGSITDGIIIATPTTTNFSSAYPLVTVDPHVEDGHFPAVISTNRDGALAAMEYLISLGHQRIGFIGGRTDLQSALRRFQGYKDGLRQANLPIDPPLIQTGDFTRQAGYTGAQTLLSLSNPPTAIFAANDQSAIGVIEAAQEAGVRVPEDLSVMGFDNIPEAAYINGGITTVDQFIDRMGYMAVEMLVNLIQKNPVESLLHRVPTQLIVRNTCRVIEPA